MATRDALERKPAAVPGAVFIDSLHSIIRTSRQEAATRPEQRAQAVAVCFNQGE